MGVEDVVSFEEFVSFECFFSREFFGRVVFGRCFGIKGLVCVDALSER